MLLCTQVRYLAIQARFRAWGANGAPHRGERKCDYPVEAGLFSMLQFIDLPLPL
jgi:dihydroorotase